MFPFNNCRVGNEADYLEFRISAREKRDTSRFLCIIVYQELCCGRQKKTLKSKKEERAGRNKLRREGSHGRDVGGTPCLFFLFFGGGGVVNMSIALRKVKYFRI